MTSKKDKAPKQEPILKDMDLFPDIKEEDIMGDKVKPNDI